MQKNTTLYSIGPGINIPSLAIKPGGVRPPFAEDQRPSATSGIVLHNRSLGKAREVLKRAEEAMKIIRDDELFGLAMIPLLVDWGIRRCNVAGCRARPNTIVQGLAPDVPLCGFCEEHFQEANVLGGVKFTLEFDDFDAFKKDSNWNLKTDLKLSAPSQAHSRTAYTTTGR